MSNESKARGTGEPPRSRPAASRRQQRATEAIAQRRRNRVLRWGGAVTVIAVLVLAAALYQRSDNTDAPSALAGIPPPRGGSSVSVDVNTLVGQPAPSFTLSDSEGTNYTITPGQGRPIVLISHMGIT